MAREVVGRKQVHEQEGRVVVAVEPALVVLRDAPLAAEGGALLAPRAAFEAEPALGLRVVEPAVERRQQAVLGVLGIVTAPPVVREPAGRRQRRSTSNGGHSHSSGGAPISTPSGSTAIARGSTSP